DPVALVAVEALQAAAELGFHALDGGAKAAQVVAQAGGGDQLQVFLGEPVDRLVQLSDRLRTERCRRQSNSCLDHTVQTFVCPELLNIAAPRPYPNGRR